MAAAQDSETVPGPAELGDEELTGKIQPFLDEWFYRILNSPVGKKWSRLKALSVLIDVFAMVGIKIPVDEREALMSAASADDAPVVAAIAAAVPGDLRKQFEATALQIQTVLHEATRILSGCETEGDEAVATIFEEAGSERGGLTQQVLKASVINAAKEVSQLRRVHTTWRKNTDERIDRLLQSAEEAEHLQQQLLAAEAQLADSQDAQKGKSKSMLIGLADGQDKALVHAIFSGWLGFVEKMHSEKDIRKKFQDQIDLCERKLFQYKEAQIANVRGVIMRGAMEETDVLLHMVWKFWTDEVKETKADGDTAAQVKAAQDRLNSFETAQRENAGKFMTRMASGNEASLKNLCLEAWIKFHQDYAQNREMEEQVKKQEAAFKQHMDAKKDEAKAVLDRMLAGTDHGLLSLIVQNWSQWLKEEKKQKELEFALSEAQSKFKTLNGRQKAGAAGVQNRVNEQVKLNLMQRVMNIWMVDTKANRIETHYNSKYDQKRRQLQGVQNLFKSFALQLEQNLGGDDDSSSRTNRSVRRSTRSKHSKGLTKGAEGSVSLPDIHQKTPSASVC